MSPSKRRKLKLAKKLRRQKGNVWVCSNMLSCNLGDRMCMFKDNFAYQRKEYRDIAILGNGSIVATNTLKGYKWPPKIVCGPTGWEPKNRLLLPMWKPVTLIETNIKLRDIEGPPK